MNDNISRRRLIWTGVAAAGAVGLSGAALLAKRVGLIPPDSHGLLGAGETLTYATQRLLVSGKSMAREFNRSEISSFAPIKGNPPENEAYERLRAEEFADWRLSVGGLVSRPTSFSLDELKRMPAENHVFLQACEEGWSFIAEWGGVPLHDVLNLVGVLPQARYVVFFGYDINYDAPNPRDIRGKWNSIDMSDAWHPQTLLAYSMNGLGELPVEHGAPLRVRVPRQLGNKSVKYLAKIVLADSVANIGMGLGSGGAERGYSWWSGI